jgi:hypothetical protein
MVSKQNKMVELDYLRFPSSFFLGEKANSIPLLGQMKLTTILGHIRIPETKKMLKECWGYEKNTDTSMNGFQLAKSRILEH